MSKVRLQHKGTPVSITVGPDAEKVRNNAPLRFRISHDVTVETGIDTWFMSRQQVEEVQLEVLTEILNAKAPGSDSVIRASELRVLSGQTQLLRTLKTAKHLTHPDVLMLIDMREHPNQYVNDDSTLAGAFRALSKKVMDLAFVATQYGPNPKQQRQDFIKMTGYVTRGMDQFVYCRPCASAANPHINFSVIPAGASYEEVRFPTYFNPRTEAKERIPREAFLEWFAFYVNELFNVYRRYLRLLNASNVEPGSEAQADADVFVKGPGEGPGEGGAAAEAVVQALAEQDARERDAGQESTKRQVEQEDRERADKEDRKAKKMAQRQADIKAAFDQFQAERTLVAQKVKAAKQTQSSTSAGPVAEQAQQPSQTTTVGESSSSAEPKPPTALEKKVATMVAKRDAAIQYNERNPKQFTKLHYDTKQKVTTAINSTFDNAGPSNKPEYTKEDLRSALRLHGFPVD